MGGATGLPFCVVTRELSMFAPATYTVRMLTLRCGGTVTCTGKWPEDLALFQNGVPACHIRRRAWGYPDCHDVIVEPQHDVLLFLGIACVHHRTERRRQELLLTDPAIFFADTTTDHEFSFF